MTQMMNRRILVSGAGVAGLTLTYWLRQFGFEVTVAERSSRLRPGGHAIDVRGSALEVIRQMGLMTEVRAGSTTMRGMSIVDGAGRELHRTSEETLSGGPLDGEDVELLRDDLTRILFESTRGDDVEYNFGDSISSLKQSESGVATVFESGQERRFDLVIGADGMHSAVRRLVFGPEPGFIHHLGSYVGIFTAPNLLDLDYWQVWIRAEEGSGGVVMSARDNTEARIYLGFESEVLDLNHTDVEAQKQIFCERLSHLGWEVPRMLEYVWAAPDFHFDSMSQIRMNTWSDGRVALLGDAGYAGSPMSGQGTSMAIVGAYILAVELAAADGDHRRGFTGYEKRMRPWVEKNQQLALINEERMRIEAAGGDPSTLDGPTLDSVKAAIALEDTAAPA